MITFVCSSLATDIHLSEEHLEYKWVDIADTEVFPDWIKPAVENITQYKIHNSN